MTAVLSAKPVTTEIGMTGAWRRLTGGLKMPTCFACIAGNLARRTFLMFILCALVPLAITGLLTVNRTSSYLTEQTTRKLESEAKSYGLQLFSRMELAQRALQTTRPDDLHNFVVDAADNNKGQLFDAVASVTDRNIKVLAGNAERLVNPDRLRDIAPDRQMWVSLDARGNTAVYLVVRSEADSTSPMLVATFNNDYLWQPDRQSNLYSICVESSLGKQLFCSMANQDMVGEQIDNSWSLFLRAQFGVEDWRITTSQARSFALATVSLYQRTLLGAMLVVLALVALLSSINIRRSHQPLEQMIIATRRIAGGQFNEPLNVTSGDEYQELAQAFNSMSSNLDRQFKTLSVLGQIDRFILDSPSLEPIIEIMLIQARALLGCELAAIALFDTETETLGRLYVLDELDSAKPTVLRMGLPLLGALRQGSETEGYVVNRDETGAAVLQPLWEIGVRQCLILPVNTRTRINAMLILGHRSVAEVPTVQRQLADDLKDRLAVALTSSEREQALFRQAHYDNLTELPNRLLFKDRLEQELAHARRDASNVVLLFLDLDRFKNINDSLGHSAGDQLLKLAAGRFTAQLRDIDTIARLGGDEFTVIIPQVRNATEISRVCARLLQCLQQPFTLEGLDYFIGASIGVAQFPNSGATVEELLRNADTAMYRAKAKGRGGYTFYEESMNQEARERVQLEGDLRQALAQNQLALHYQPQIDLTSGQIIGAEALLRWYHPQRGMVSPLKFIPIAEDTGLIVAIGEWVIKTACAQLQQWRQQGLALHSISVNVAVPQLLTPDFVERVNGIMRHFQIQPGMLELEVTESTLATDIEQTTRILQDLSNTGVRIAIDDFGTGYSSLSYLQKLPIDVLKIDRTFMPTKFDGKDQVICDAVLALAHALGKTVVAEGVENAEQMLYLQNNGCHIGQGYFFGKPVTGTAFSERLLEGAMHTPPNQIAV
jgi:diguanylate cyclase (GGDEF)-like protein